MNFTRSLVLIPILAALAFPGTASIQEEKKPQEEVYTFEMGVDGMKFEAFVMLMQRLLQRPVTYDERRLNGNNKTIRVVGRSEIKASELESYIHEVLAAHGLALLPLGTGPHSILLIDDVQTSQLLKQRAIAIPYAEIDSCAKRVASIFTTVIPLEFVEATLAQRALNNLIQEHRASFVHPIAATNSLVVCGDGRLMVTFNELVKKMEAAAQGEKLKNYLEHKAQVPSETVDEAK